jgi:type II secretory ATPase GspE/PulE/Tfp pilus assembly ATPase PilB-like protein
MSEKIEELAVRKAPASEIKKEAIKGGMVTMTQDGLIKALKGITTIDEVMRVTTTQIKELPE